MRVSEARSWTRVAQALLLLLSLAACKDGVSPSTVTVALSPPGRLTLDIGDTLTVRASVQNGGDAGVVFSTSNAAVASVEQTGLVRALSAGTANITATSAADPRASASVEVQVQPDRPTSLVIESVLDASESRAINPSAVQGLIFVQLAVDPGSAARLEILVDTAVVPCQSFSAAAQTTAASQANVKCPVNTAGFDSLTGAPRFQNRPVTIGARLISANGRVLRSTSYQQQLVLANRDLIVTRVSAPRQANDASGLRWVDGDVIVTAFPVLFGGGRSLSRVEFVYRSPGGSTHVLPDTTAPFSITFPESDHLRGVTDPRFQVVVRSATRDGSEGPGGTTSPIRYDNQAPTPGSIAPREWVGARVEFASTYNPVGESDSGVGRVQPRFYVGDPALSALGLITQGREVTRGSELAQAPKGSYRAAVRVCDALDNCDVPGTFLFGVDLTAPTAGVVGFSDRAINPGRDLEITLSDDLSGFDTRPLEVTVQHVNGRIGSSQCGPEVEGRDLPGRSTAAGACVADSVEVASSNGGTATSRLFVPRSTAGYYNYTATAFDRAGNRATTLTRSVLVDASPPSLSGLAVPAQLIAGEEVAFSVSAADNVEVTDVAFRLSYPVLSRPGSTSLSFDTLSSEGRTPVGRAFDAVLSDEVTVSRRFPFVRTLTYAASGTAATRLTSLVDSLQVTATDAAGLRGTASRALSRASFGNDSSVADPFPSINSAAASVDRARVCTDGCETGDPTSMRITLRVEDQSGSGLPFARVYYYRRSADRTTVLIGAPRPDARTVVDGTQRSVTYSFDYTPAVGLSGEFSIFAVGVSSRGSALVSDVGAGAPRVTFYRRSDISAVRGRR